MASCPSETALVPLCCPPWSAAGRSVPPSTVYCSTTKRYSRGGSGEGERGGRCGAVEGGEGAPEEETDGEGGALGKGEAAPLGEGEGGALGKAEVGAAAPTAAARASGDPAANAARIARHASAPSLNVPTIALIGLHVPLVPPAPPLPRAASSRVQVACSETSRSFPVTWSCSGSAWVRGASHPSLQVGGGGEPLQCLGQGRLPSFPGGGWVGGRL